jgi:N-acetylglucosamine kinase-like BadF-type ATPase
MANYILAIDQGNTHTRAVIADQEGCLLSLGLAAGGCHAYVGMEKAMQGIAEAARAALRQAEVQPEQVALILGGISGADWADEYPLLEGNIRHLGICERVKVVNDSLIALRAGTARPYGAILILGSGGNCAVRAPDGRELIYGYFQEWPLQGADGLGRRVLQAVYRAHTGRTPPTSLTRRVLQAFQMKTVEELLRADVEGRLLAEGIRGLAPVLFEEGYRGDAQANAVIHDFGLGCAGLVTAGLKRFDMTRLEVEVVLSGSIFKAQGSLLREALATGIHVVAPGACLVTARYEPVVGAALLGLEHLGIEITDPVKVQVEQGAKQLGLFQQINS